MSLRPKRLENFNDAGCIRVFEQSDGLAGLKFAQGIGHRTPPSFEKPVVLRHPVDCRELMCFHRCLVDALRLRGKWGDFLDLAEVEYKWGRFAKIGNQHRDFLLLPVTFAHCPHKFGEWTLNNTYALAFGEIELRLKRLLLFRRIC